MRVFFKAVVVLLISCSLAMASGVEAYYKNGYQDLPTDAFIHGMVQIKNGFAGSVNLTDLAVEYYFDSEGASVANCSTSVYWFDSGQSSDVSVSLTPFTPETILNGKKTNMFARISFRKSILLSAGKSTTVQFGINRKDWKSFHETNHYSYLNQSYNSGFVVQPKIVIRQKSTGAILWGTEPRESVTLPPVVVISSPAEGAFLQTSPAAIVWSVDGAVQSNFTTEPLAEGANKIIRSYTGSTGLAGADTVNVTLDTQAPVVTISSPVSGTVVNKSPYEISWSVDGVTQTTNILENLVEGVNHISRSSTDAAGNIGNASVDITLDTKAPVVAITYPAEGAVLDATPVAIQWSIDGEAQFGDIFVNLTEGSNRITRTTTDAAENVGTASVNVTYQPKLPVVEIISPVTGSVVTTPTIMVSWSVDGVSQTTETTENLVAGTNTITRSFTRNGKTVTASVTVTYVPLMVAPAVEITSPANGDVVTTSPITVNWAVDGTAQSTETTENLVAGSNTITRTFTRNGKTGTASVVVTYSPVIVDPTIPADPATIAPKLDSTQITSMKDATSFLYTGDNPIQKDLTATIDEKRVCVIRGTVTDRDGKPLSGIEVSISNHGEYGHTKTRADGVFDLAVNGGGSLTVHYESENYLESERLITVPVKDYTWAPEVVLIKKDSKVSIITPGADSMQVAQGSVVTDVDGTRQATVFFPAGVTVTGGNGGSIAVRATEYTVGENGPKAMPATLPPTSGYTYCVELAVDGMENVSFSKPLPVYVDNFLGFPVGGIVPAGYYDSDKDAWIPSDNGKIVKLLSVVDGKAVLDVTGSGQPATEAQLTAQGITSDELVKIAGVHTVGKSYWRVPVTHFTPWDCNWPYGPEEGAESPNNEMPLGNQDVPNSCKNAFNGF